MTPSEFVSAAGRTFVTFDERTQDSGNVSYGVEAEGRRYFVKTAGSPNSSALLSHQDRVALLRNAVRLHQSVRHPALVPLRNVIESSHGPLLVYDWAAGELLAAPAVNRSDPATAHFRFRRLPPAQILSALEVVFDLHCALAVNGYVACDFYDGALLYDFDAARVSVIDLDHYQLGPFVNHMGRRFGSTRFMAPEEFEPGTEINEATTVHTLGRTILHLLTDPVEGSFRAPEAIRQVALRASSPLPEARYQSVSEFVRAWQAARVEGAEGS